MSTRRLTPSAARWPSLDGLRGIAILLVLFHHLTVYEGATASGRMLASVAEFTGHGVDLFFALSGFLIAKQLERSAGQPGFGYTFWLRRAAKIAPLYFLAVFGVFVVLKSLLVWTGHHEKLIWLTASQAQWPWYAAGLSNVRNALDGRFINPALDVCWSLAVEIQFYLLAFLAARLVPRPNWQRVAVAALIGAVLFRAGCVVGDASWITILVLTPGRLDAFACGALAALMPGRFARMPLIFVGALLCTPFLVEWSRALPWVQIAGYSLVAVASGSVVSRAVQTDETAATRSWLAHPWLVYLGHISYSVYLTHLPIRAFLRDYTLPADRLLSSPGAWMAQIAFWICTGALCLGIGSLVYRFVEEPARQRILKIASRGRAGPQLAHA